MLKYYTLFNNFKEAEKRDLTQFLVFGEESIIKISQIHDPDHPIVDCGCISPHNP
jgi:hypothetical protein